MNGLVILIIVIIFVIGLSCTGYGIYTIYDHVQNNKLTISSSGFVILGIIVCLIGGALIKHEIDYDKNMKM